MLGLSQYVPVTDFSRNDLHTISLRCPFSLPHICIESMSTFALSELREVRKGAKLEIWSNLNAAMVFAMA